VREEGTLTMPKNQALRRMRDYQRIGTNYIMRSLLICNFHVVLLGGLSEEGSDLW
jgi:hypothetical protein